MVRVSGLDRLDVAIQSSLGVYLLHYAAGYPPLQALTASG